MFNSWKVQPVEFKEVEHGYSLVSKYYRSKEIKGIRYYKITEKGLYKIKEGRLCIEIHNFMVYLAGKGLRKIADNQFENGVIV